MYAPLSTLCLVLAMCLHISLSQQCDDGYEFFPMYNASRYKLAPFPLNWADAIVQCQSDGGGSHLVVINSEEEAEVVRTLIARLEGTGAPWSHVGISDINTEGIWRTVLGGLVSASGYDKWVDEQPNGGEDENCGYVQGDVLYRDSQCSTAEPFICEKPFE